MKKRKGIRKTPKGNEDIWAQKEQAGHTGTGKWEDEPEETKRRPTQHKREKAGRTPGRAKGGQEG